VPTPKDYLDKVQKKIDEYKRLAAATPDSKTKAYFMAKVQSETEHLEKLKNRK
jgi:hypothetical protein